MTYDKTSILAHLASRFTNRTEDLAGEALAFILSRSAIARRVLREKHAVRDSSRWRCN